MTGSSRIAPTTPTALAVVDPGRALAPLLPAGVEVHWLAVQALPAPALRQVPSMPLLLHASALPPLTLARVLLAWPVAGAPILAMVDPADRRSMRLLYAHPEMRLILARDVMPATVQHWLRAVPRLRPAHTRPMAAALILPGTLPLSIEDLRMLVGLAQAESTFDAADKLGISRRALARRMRQLRTALHMPDGTQTHYRPADFVRHVWQALADLP